MKKQTYQGQARIYYRRLHKAWQLTEENKSMPDSLIKELFRLAAKDCRDRKKILKVMVFTHSLQSYGVKHKQRYRITGLDELVLMPPKNSGLNELASCIFKI